MSNMPIIPVWNLESMFLFSDHTVSYSTQVVTYLLYHVGLLESVLKQNYHFSLLF